MTEKATYSPGPWKVGYHAMDVMAESPVPGKGPFKICDIRGWGYLTGKGHGAIGLPDEEAAAIQHANARLIAAAPDMLRALRLSEIVFRCDACGGSGNVTTVSDELDECPSCGGNYTFIIGVVRTAIAKATGEANLGDERR